MRKNTSYFDENYLENIVGNYVYSVLTPLKNERAKALANRNMTKAKLIENEIKRQIERLKREGFIK